MAREHHWVTAYRKELKEKYTPQLIFITGATALVGALIGSLLYVAYSSGGGAPFRQGMTYAAIIAVIPAIIGTSMAHSSFLKDHAEALRHFHLLGVPRSKLKREVWLQALVLALIAAVFGAILGLAVLKLLIGILFIGIPVDFPQRWGSFISVLPTTLGVTILLYALGALKTTKTLHTVLNPQRPQPRTARHTLFAILGKCAALVNILLGIWLLLRPSHGLTVSTFLITLPFLAFTLSPYIARFWSQAFPRTVVSIYRWTPAAIAARSMHKTGSLATVGLISILISLPLSAYMWNNVSAFGAKNYSASELSSVPVLAPQEGSLLSEPEARRVCEELAEDCRGIAWWVPAQVSDAGVEFVEHPNDYVLAAEPPAVLAELKGDNPVPEDERSYFNSDTMTLFRGFTEEVRAPRGGIVIATVNNPNIPQIADQKLELLPANQWAQHADTALLYGPHGTGTTEFIPLFAYTLLTLSVIIMVIFMSRKKQLRRFFEPLHVLGLNSTQQTATRVWTFAFAFFNALVAAVIAVSWYSCVGAFSTTGRVLPLLPSMPAGLWILFGIVATTCSIIPALHKEG
ncbi:hypothetical protein WG936_09390 [Corynebacterium sp. H127]|uniref:FtsX-like permease family protein n=1 Tax=Corynebacterium sp. H127 TaxID=3133418 RepID=UPI0030A514BD